MRTISLLLLSCMFLASCSTLNSVIKAKEEGKGTVVIYEIGEEDSWNLAKKSFRWAGADAIEEYKEEGYMLTSKGMNLVSSGSVMGAWIEPAGNGKMKVTVISKRRISTQIATGMTESKFHKYYKAGTAILAKGEKLPLSAPDLDKY